MTTLAGSGTGALTDGVGTSASFNGPNGLALDTNGAVYVGDRFTNSIRKVSSAGAWLFVSTMVMF